MAKKEGEVEELLEVKSKLQKELGIMLSAGAFEEWKKALTLAINDLIQTDFNRLVAILYRLDINESKLKYLLKDSQAGDAAIIITNLIIERELQKIKSRREFRQKNDGIDENERW